MTVYEQSKFVYGGTYLLYFAAAIWLSWRQGLFRAGYLSLLILILPLLWERIVPGPEDDNSPLGRAIMLLPLVLFSALLMALGVIAAMASRCTAGKGWRNKSVGAVTLLIGAALSLIVGFRAGGMLMPATDNNAAFIEATAGGYGMPGTTSDAPLRKPRAHGESLPNAR